MFFGAYLDERMSEPAGAAAVSRFGKLPARA